MSSSLSKKHLFPLYQNELDAVFEAPDFAMEIEHFRAVSGRVETMKK
jgi:hypothetical protein